MPPLVLSYTKFGRHTFVLLMSKRIQSIIPSTTSSNTFVSTGIWHAPARDYSNESGYCRRKMIAQHLPITSQQQETFQAEMRQVAGLLHQQQQATLARVECVERLQAEPHANVSGHVSAMNYNPFPGTVGHREEHQSIKQEADQNEADQPQERRRILLNTRSAGAHSAEIREARVENQIAPNTQQPSR
ncbi:uncharacterized protein BO97DRAFT_402164 [Aspergillus homomorphus CBS 101889]|uniref:Uncharacterized protein n=1 Tax=Aspergillus homomorphus (strain CBS 101889) TaxID=1450537 RepID=A0A395IEM0_ASPHC|nr:hypothetical protein BO97DRAFT_402164 [Aspergillus homomorphus CBS 101889]RAL17608.1 hypothetical protein BO97DRAFT_402164 [Aspergillus homomorphus CBS 101889]